MILQATRLHAVDLKTCQGEESLTVITVPTHFTFKCISAYMQADEQFSIEFMLQPLARVKRCSAISVDVYAYVL